MFPEVRNIATHQDHLRSEIFLAHLQHSETLEMYKNKEKLFVLNVYLFVF